MTDKHTKITNKIKIFQFPGFIGAGFVFLFFAGKTFAQETKDAALEVVSKTGLSQTGAYTIISNVINIFLGLLGLIALIIFLYAGWLYLRSGGNQDVIAKAKKLMKNAVIGMLIILTAFTVTSFILKLLYRTTETGNGAGDDNSGCVGDACGPGGLGGLSRFELVSHDPSNEATNVKICKSVQGVFNAQVDKQSLERGMSVFDETGKSANIAPQGTLALSYDKKAFRFRPQGNEFTPNSTFRVELTREVQASVETTNPSEYRGKALQGNEAWRFTTGTESDTELPQVAQQDRVSAKVYRTYPEAGQRDVCLASPIQTIFTEEMDVITFDPKHLVLKKMENGSAIGDHIPVELAQINSDFTSVSFRSLNNLEANTTYQVTLLTKQGEIAGFQDSCANPLNGATDVSAALNQPADYVWQFTTGTTVNCEPKITSVVPGSGKYNDQIVINGAFFGIMGDVQIAQQIADTKCTLVDGLTDKNCLVQWRDNEIRIGVPFGATTGKVTVARGDRSAVSASDFEVTSPYVHTTSPNPARPSELLQLVGEKFGSSRGVVEIFRYTGSGVNRKREVVMIDSPPQICASAKTWGQNSITVQLPPDIGVGVWFVRIQRSDKAWSNVRVLPIEAGSPRPGFCSILPEEGEQGISVTVTGVSLTEVSAVEFWGSKQVDTLRFIAREPGAIQLLVPPDAETGSVIPISSQGKGAGVWFKVVTSSTTPPPPPPPPNIPSINLLSPNHGPVSQFVTISGTHLGAQTGIVEFLQAGQIKGTASIPAECITRVSTSAVSSSGWNNAVVVIAVPPLDAGGYDVRVVTADNQKTNTLLFTVDNTPKTPGLCALNPQEGEIGISVVATGAGLAGIHDVLFGTASVSVSQLTDTGFTMIAPAVQSGQYEVVARQGKVTSNGIPFVIKVAEKPLLISVSPKPENTPVPRNCGIALGFNTKMKASLVENKIVVKDEKGNVMAGSWSPSFDSDEFRFVPVVVSGSEIRPTHWQNASQVMVTVQDTFVSTSGALIDCSKSVYRCNPVIQFLNTNATDSLSGIAIQPSEMTLQLGGASGHAITRVAGTQCAVVDSIPQWSAGRPAIIGFLPTSGQALEMDIVAKQIGETFVEARVAGFAGIIPSVRVVNDSTNSALTIISSEPNGSNLWPSAQVAISFNKKVDLSTVSLESINVFDTGDDRAQITKASQFSFGSHGSTLQLEGTHWIKGRSYKVVVDKNIITSEDKHRLVCENVAGRKCEYIFSVTVDDPPITRVMLDRSRYEIVQEQSAVIAAYVYARASPISSEQRDTRPVAWMIETGSPDYIRQKSVTDSTLTVQAVAARVGNEDEAEVRASLGTVAVSARVDVIPKVIDQPTDPGPFVVESFSPPANSLVCRNIAPRIVFNKPLKPQELLDAVLRAKFQFGPNLNYTAKFENEKTLVLFPDNNQLEPKRKYFVNLQPRLIFSQDNTALQCSGGLTTIIDPSTNTPITNSCGWNFTTSPQDTCPQVSEVRIEKLLPDGTPLADARQQRDGLFRVGEKVLLSAQPGYRKNGTFIALNYSVESWNVDKTYFEVVSQQANSVLLEAKKESPSTVAIQTRVFDPETETYIAGSVELKVLNCDNRFVLEDREYNTELSGCWDRFGGAVAKPDMRAHPELLKTKAQGLRDPLVKQYLIPVVGASNGENIEDAIIFWIGANPQRLELTSWINQATIPIAMKGALTARPTIDGYYAATGGSSVYVLGMNVKNKQAYTTVYVLSYNDDAHESTKALFQELVQGFRVNDTISSDTRARLLRDYHRVRDMTSMYDKISAVGVLPTFSAGSFEANHTTSAWSSWQQEFGSRLGVGLPLDPKNIFGKCDADGKDRDQKTCWNKQVRPSFMCPASSYVYQYRVQNDKKDFELKANFEYTDITWQGEGDAFPIVVSSSSVGDGENQCVNVVLTKNSTH